MGSRLGWATRVAAALAIFALACGRQTGSPRISDQGDLFGNPNRDGGPLPDGGTALDGGSLPDGGGGDGGTPPTDGGIVFGGPGPWPIANVTHTHANGILESPIVGFTTDETQNRWVATRSALYLLRPGQAVFRRYSEADGLHLQNNPAVYCDRGMPDGDRACPIYGGAAAPGIMEIVGGGPNEVFVGYAGAYTETSTFDLFDPDRHSGKLERVRLNPNGSLTVDRFDMVSSRRGARFWHNRTVYRMVYDHFIHPHELYVGTNHGVDLMRPDRFRYPRPGEWFDDANIEYMADHLHPRVCYHLACVDESNQRMGGWRGLALAPDGDIWVAGNWTAGKIRWDPDLEHWSFRAGGEAFVPAFGDPYPIPPNQYGFINEPVFRPPLEGDPVSLSAVSVAPDGRVWFGSNALYSSGDYVDYGIAVWNGRFFTYYDPIADAGMSEQKVQDLIALSDGRILLAGPNTGLVLWNPATGRSLALQAPDWLADNQVKRVAMDTMVRPVAIHVSTNSGATVLRQLPP